MNQEPEGLFELGDHPGWLGETIPGSLRQLPENKEYVVGIYPKAAREQILKGEIVQTAPNPDGTLSFFKTNIVGRQIRLGQSRIMPVEENDVPLVQHWTTL